MTEKDKLNDRIESSYDELMDLIKSLGPDGLRITGADGWAVKDHVIHLGAWELSLIGLLEGSDRPTTMGVPGVERETEALNRAVWALHRDKTPEEAVAFFTGHTRCTDRPVLGWVATPTTNTKSRFRGLPR